MKNDNSSRFVSHCSSIYFALNFIPAPLIFAVFSCCRYYYCCHLHFVVLIVFRENLSELISTRRVIFPEPISSFICLRNPGHYVRLRKRDHSIFFISFCVAQQLLKKVALFYDVFSYSRVRQLIFYTGIVL